MPRTDVSGRAAAHDATKQHVDDGTNTRHVTAVVDATLGLEIAGRVPSVDPREVLPNAGDQRVVRPFERRAIG
jgi:hypothetical protein